MKEKRNVTKNIGYLTLQISHIDHQNRFLTLSLIIIHSITTIVKYLYKYYPLLSRMNFTIYLKEHTICHQN